MRPQRKLLAVKILVDNPSHTRLAVSVIVLSAVEPDRAGILDLNLEHLVALSLADGEEAAEEGVGIFGLAGRVKGGLDDGVVQGVEVEFDYGADFGDYVVGVKD